MSKQKTLQEMAHWLEIELLNSNRFTLKLTATQSVSATLKQLVNQLELTQVEMQTADLHQLYLMAMAQHQLREQALFQSKV